MNLKFDQTTISIDDEENGDNGETVITSGHGNITSLLESFELGFVFRMAPGNNLILREPVSDLLLYLGNNPQNLQRLGFNYYGFAPTAELVAEVVVLEVISKLPSLISCAMKVFPKLTECLMAVFG